MLRKHKELILCIVMDLAGMSSFTLPLIGEIGDIIFAPLSGLVFYFLFGKKLGIFGGAFNFLEELLPGTDFMPSFCLAWVYKYVINKERPVE